MTPFSGWQMPLQYGKVIEEHHAVRNAAGLFDISHMGLVTVHSRDVEKTRQFLNKLVPQDLTKLAPGKALYTQFLNEDGGIIDDIIIYEMPTYEQQMLLDFKEFLVVCNAGNTAKDIEWMKRHAEPGIQIELLSNRYSLFALQGPRFKEILSALRYDETQLPKRFHIIENRLDSTTVLLSRTGYTGEDGVEIIVPSQFAEPLWNYILEVGEPFGLRPVGLAARDTLRLEAAYPLHGHDISESDTPLEAGLGWSVKLDQETDFIGKQALQRQKAEGVPKKMYCFRLKKKSIARQHDVIVKNGEPVGEITSGSISPLWNEPIAMGYIQTGKVSGPGNIVQIRVRGTDVDAEIVERPFYKSQTL